MSDSHEAPSSDPIDQMRKIAFVPMALCAAVDLGVFDQLANGPMTVEQVAERIGVKPRRLGMMMHALAVGEYLEVNERQFSNAPISDYYLVKGKPGYRGAVVQNWHEQWIALMQTAESIKTDIPQAKLDFSGMSKDELAGFLRGLHGRTVGIGARLAKDPAFEAAHTVLDVGGGSGGVTIGLCQVQSHLQTTVLDFPAVLEVTTEMIGETGLQDRIETEAGNIVQGPASRSFDVAIARALFQVLSEDDCQSAAHNIAQSLNSGGKLFILGNIVDDDGLTPSEAVLQNVMFLNTYDDGQGYREAVYRQWLENAGFKDVKREPPFLGNELLTARKA